MFDLIQSIIDHIFSGSMTIEEDYIYTMCAIVIPICIILVWDAILCIFRSFTRFK